MIKFKKSVLYEIERYPNFCEECPAYSEHRYRCHNECGTVSDCELGYMAGRDMRDYNGKRFFIGCGMRHDKRVVIKED